MKEQIKLEVIDELKIKFDKQITSNISNNLKIFEKKFVKDTKIEYNSGKSESESKKLKEKLLKFLVM
jgi:hypothetical protein